MTVVVIVVNWNSGSFLKQCLESLQRQTRQPDHIVVVDNASTDSSLELAQPCLGRAQILRFASNIGFARANNEAVRAAPHCDAVALLNPDAIADPDWLKALMDAAESCPDIAALASQMRLLSAPDYLDGAGDSYHVSGRAWRNGHRSPGAAWPQETADVFSPCAAAALYRRGPFQEVGGFDERFFCYFEDVDLAFRLRLRGYRCLYVPTAIVQHASSATTGYRSDFAVYHGERNAVWTWFKNMPALLLALYLPQHLLLNAAALAYYPLRGQGRVVLRAKLDAVKMLPSVLKDRWPIQRARHVGAWSLRRSMARGVLQPYFGRYSVNSSGT